MSWRSAARRAVSTDAPSSAAISAGQVRALDQVVEHVLTVAGAELELAQQSDQLRVEALHPRLEGRPLALLDDPLLDLRPGVLVGLLDQRRIDPAVGDQPLHRQAGDLATYPVEGRQHDG